MRAPVRRLLAVVTSLAFVLVGFLATALPVAACDCMAMQPMEAYAGSPDWVIFSGTVQPPEAQGTPIVVTRWFQGEGAASVVRVQGQWGVGGASCETPLPLAGSEWIFIASRFEGELAVNLCTPHAAVGSDAGAAMLADATATFGDGGAAPPGAPATPVEGTGDTAIDPRLLLAAVGVVGGIGLIAAAVLVSRGRRSDRPAA